MKKHLCSVNLSYVFYSDSRLLNSRFVYLQFVFISNCFIDYKKTEKAYEIKHRFVSYFRRKQDILTSNIVS
jgi:hypothetical protein